LGGGCVLGGAGGVCVVSQPKQARVGFGGVKKIIRVLGVWGWVGGGRFVGWLGGGIPIGGVFFWFLTAPGLDHIVMEPQGCLAARILFLVLCCFPFFFLFACGVGFLSALVASCDLLCFIPLCTRHIFLAPKAESSFHLWRPKNIQATASSAPVQLSVVGPLLVRDSL